jgi:hypothetical protein
VVVAKADLIIDRGSKTSSNLNLKVRHLENPCSSLDIENPDIGYSTESYVKCQSEHVSPAVGIKIGTTVDLIRHEGGEKIDLIPVSPRVGSDSS